MTLYLFPADEFDGSRLDDGAYEFTLSVANRQVRVRLTPQLYERLANEYGMSSSPIDLELARLGLHSEVEYLVECGYPQPIILSEV